MIYLIGEIAVICSFFSRIVSEGTMPLSELFTQSKER
jgi:hypothetical protein